MDKQQSSQTPQPGMMTHAQAEEMLRLQRHANAQRGCLMSIVWTLLFGVFYWAWLAVKWTWKGSVALVRLGWRWTVTYPVVWTIALSRQAVRQSQAFSERYGWRGWAVVAGAVVALAILGSIIH